MGNYVVAVSIDKVQTFLYEALYSGVQDKQTNSGTLSTIIESSQMISGQFYKDIGIEGDGPFAGCIDEPLLTTSGNCVFITSLSESKISKNLDEIFKKYYTKYSGQLLVKYTYFPLASLPLPSQGEDEEFYKLYAIKESKRRLREDACLNQIIERNQDLLFKFQKSLKPPKAEPQANWENDYSAFSQTINKLYDEQDAENENHFRIAVIKGDLDGMGELFNSIQNYGTYKAVSRLLTEYMSLRNLHQITQQFQKQDLEIQRDPLRLYPLYIAGDDIFFAVPASQLIAGIDICKHILKQLNEEIKQAIHKDKQGGMNIELSMSIGVDFTFNREPIRYYYARVQKQLDTAKKEASRPQAAGNGRPVHHMKISINHLVFHDDKEDNNADLLTWQTIVHGVERLKHAMSCGFAAHHFLYGLLNKITDPETYNNNLKYSNALFYHLIPQHLESGNEQLREAELWLLKSIIDQILKRTENKDKAGKTKSTRNIFLDDEHKKRLEGYVRILLLFTDPRFNKSTQPIKFKATQVKSDLFNKPLKYIYETSLGSSVVQSLRDVFIKADYYVPKDFEIKKKKGRASKVGIYRTLRISNALFHRIKHKYLNHPDTVAKLITAANPQTPDEVENLLDKSKQEHKAPPSLAFDIGRFLRASSNPEVWTADHVDALAVFYKLKDKSIQLKTMYDFKALREAQNRNRKRSGGKPNGKWKNRSQNQR
jgi:hypothetical protein